MEFSQFIFEAEEEEKNVLALLKNLPKNHAALMKGFKFEYIPGNTLDGDDAHIGSIQGKKVTIAGPWRYGREFTTLHEIAHQIYEKLVDKKLRKEWSDLVAKTKKSQIATIEKKGIEANALNQNDEEIFCMIYAATYSGHPPLIWYNPEWTKFIKNLP